MGMGVRLWAGNRNYLYADTLQAGIESLQPHMSYSLNSPKEVL